MKINPAPIMHKDGQKNKKINLKIIQIKTEQRPFTGRHSD